MSEKNSKILIVGLGNPGKKYVDTRHNIGFEMIDTLASYFNIKITKTKCRALIGEGNISGVNVILAKPQTYMNLSGESVRDLVSFYKIDIENIIIIYDDISLDVGKIRIRLKGSAGGHNGMKNIIIHLNTDEFSRIRIGVGKPDCELIDYVLSTFSKQDVTNLIEIAKIIPNVIETIISDGVANTMNKYN